MTGSKQYELTPLDALFREVGTYRQSSEFKELLNFIVRLRGLAPFNAMLVHIQRPGAWYVATANDWLNKFKRWPKRNATPLVILKPFGPVAFVFDVKDTEGEPIPEAALDFFVTKGKLPSAIFKRTIGAAAGYGVDVKEEKDAPGNSAGFIIRLSAEARQIFKDLKFSPYARYGLVINSKHTLETKYATIVHELAHLFCGHLGFTEGDWWECPNEEHDEIICELEAESVAWLVCSRCGLEPPAARYLDRYLNGHVPQIPSIWLNRMLMAADEIEGMGSKKWRPKKRRS
jgi:hypothetical protein